MSERMAAVVKPSIPFGTGVLILGPTGRGSFIVEQSILVDGSFFEQVEDIASLCREYGVSKVDVDPDGVGLNVAAGLATRLDIPVETGKSA